MNTADKPRPPVVSVITPFLDPPEAFFRQSVESVLAQTLGEWELLLVDDGSVGTATDIARGYAQSNPARIVYLEFERHGHRGLPAARNLGLQHARGEFVATLDADDVWAPEKLERQVELFARWPRAAMVYGTTRYWYGWTGRSEDVQRDYVQQHALDGRWQGEPATGERLVEPPALLTMYLRREAAVPSASNIMVRRSTMVAVGGFEARFQLYEDQSLYAKVCVAAPVVVSDECWDSYRQHPDSLCASARGTDREERSRREYLEWLSGYLERAGIDDVPLRRALKWQLWTARRGHFGRIIDGIARRVRAPR